MSKKEELAKKAAIIEQQLTAMQKRLSDMMSLLINIDTMIHMVENAKEGDEALVPVNMVILPVRLQSDKMLFPVGAGYYLELDKQKLLKKLNEMRGKIQEEYESLSKSMKDLEEQLLLLMKEAGYVGSS
jgi:prefoldin alpha subunit